MRLYSLISIIHVQFGTPTLTKNSKLSYKLFKTNAYLFFLQLDNRTHVGITEFKKINWLPVDCRFRLCLTANVFKFFDNKYPLCMKDVFDNSCMSQTSTRYTTMKLSQPLRRTSYGQNCISFLAPSVWNNLPNELKRCTNLNTSLRNTFFAK